jgi:hypothetical protein
MSFTEEKKYEVFLSTAVLRKAGPSYNIYTHTHKHTHHTHTHTHTPHKED